MTDQTDSAGAPRREHQPRLILSTLLLLLLASCGGGTAPQMPPPGVEVVTVEATSIQNIIELPGRVQAMRTAEVRARVTGIVGKLLYREGSEVRAGQPLFSIDPREMQANMASFQAALQSAEAQATNARQDVERYQPLLADQAISKQEYDTAVARMNTAAANVLQAQAQVANARLSLGYSTVTAPISGRVGRALVTEGALVSASGGTLLTVVEQVSPIYVNFAQTSAEILTFRRDIASGRLQIPALDRVQVELQLEDGSRFSQMGRLDFLAPSLDEATGSVAIRAEFPNPGGGLLPGQFVRARIFAGTLTDSILLPQRAVSVGPQGGMVLVVKADDTVEARPVTLGPLRGANWVVSGGLKPGERVIIAGQQKVQPGMPVQILPNKAAAAEKSAQPAPAGESAPPASAARG